MPAGAFSLSEVTAGGWDPFQISLIFWNGFQTKVQRRALELFFGIYSKILWIFEIESKNKFRGGHLNFFLESIPKFPGNIYTDSPKNTLNLLGNFLGIFK